MNNNASIPLGNLPFPALKRLIARTALLMIFAVLPLQAQDLEALRIYITLTNAPAGYGLATDSKENLYIADGHSKIFKRTAGGELTVFAGTTELGRADGAREVALLNGPTGLAIDASDNLFVADSGNNTIRKITPEGVVSTVAGQGIIPFGPPSGGSSDGPGSLARFYVPTALAVDRAGTIYVADSGNDTIRKIAPDGIVSTLAGRPFVILENQTYDTSSYGSVDGIGSAARFRRPSGIALDPQGNIYVTEGRVTNDGKANHTVRKITPSGEVTTLAGTPVTAGSADGLGGAALFSNPSAIILGPSGDFFIADSGNNTIRKMTPEGRVTTIAGLAGAAGKTDGYSQNARFSNPVALTFDSTGNLYVADWDNNAIRVGLALAGPPVIITGPERLSVEVTRQAAFEVLANGAPPLSYRWRINDVDVSDSNTNRLVLTVGPGLKPENDITVFVSNPAGTATASTTLSVFNRPPVIQQQTGDRTVPISYSATFSVQADGTPPLSYTWWKGDMQIPGATNSLLTLSNFQPSDAGAYRVTVQSPYGQATASNFVVSTTARYTFGTVVGSGQNGNADGPAGAATFGSPYALALDAQGNLFVADAANQNIRKVSAAGEVTTVAGRVPLDDSESPTGGYADGPALQAQFQNPHGIAVDAGGTVYVADTGNHCIRKIAPGGLVTTFAGFFQQPPFFSPVGGFTDGTGSSARFDTPQGIALGPDGNLYVADTGNNAVRKVTPDGVVTTVAGKGGIYQQPLLSDVFADGNVSAARFFRPWAVAVDAATNIYVADAENRLIRKITSQGEVITLAGVVPLNLDFYSAPMGSEDGIGNTAQFGAPVSLAVDRLGNIYVADAENRTIRKITADRMVTTIAGQPQEYGNVDGSGYLVRFGANVQCAWGDFFSGISCTAYDGPHGLAVAQNGDLYLADTYNHTIRKASVAPAILSRGSTFGFRNGAFTFDLANSQGSVAVETSTDLLLWTPILTNSPANITSFTDPETVPKARPRQFYRARQVTGP